MGKAMGKEKPVGATATLPARLTKARELPAPRHRAAGWGQVLLLHEVCSQGATGQVTRHLCDKGVSDLQAPVRPFLQD